MSARTFRAPSIPAALSEARSELGESVLILDIRQTRQGAEVRAAVPRPRLGLRPLFEKLRASRDAEVAYRQASGGHLVYASPVSDELARDLPPPPELRMDRGPGLRIVGGAAGPDPVAVAMRGLDLPPDIAARLVTAAGDGSHPWEQLLAWFESRWPVPPAGARDEGPAVHGFVGPRGVGRSTLVRGLAARAARDEPGRVVLIEVGFAGRAPEGNAATPGVCRLRARHPAELAGLLAEQRKASAVLLDLPSVELDDDAGRSALLRFTAALDRAAPSRSWHGVLSARWSARECARALRGLGEVGLSAVAWTDLDRVADPGTVIAATLRADLPPSFLHGDGSGDGEQSGAASWESLLGWLAERVPGPRPTRL